MTLEQTIFWLGVTLLGLFLSALFSGMETGVYCVNRVRLIVRAAGAGGHAPDWSANLLRRELDRPDRILATLLIGNNGANYLGSLGITALLSGAGHGDWAIVAINAAILTPLLFIFGETLPKDLFRAEADRLSPRLAPALVAVRWLATITLMLPLVRGFAAIVTRLLGGEGEAALRTAREKIGALLKEGVRHGVLTESQTALLDRAFTLRDLRVRDRMTPWRQVAWIGADWPRERIENALRSRPFSRWPVVDGHGKIVGVLESLRLWTAPNAKPRSLIKPPTRLKPTDSVRTALLKMREARTRTAIVEENGRPVGIVSIKDLVEPLTGPLVAW
ncbi:MAG: DUF21 domain-containing protein [Phycisphaeraceae bacterium]|nr:MAG: DUF21 domain-containing protein [Phycisphaeraceae bacterium]